MENEIETTQSQWIILSGEKQEVDGARGVRFEELSFNNTNPEIRDGAQIEIAPGGRTPVQLVIEDIVITDIPVSGSLMFFHITKEGAVSYYYLHSDRGTKPIWFEVRKGEAMCWYAHSGQDKPAKIMEWETPGFHSFEGDPVRTITEDNLPEENRDSYMELFSMINYIDEKNKRLNEKQDLN